MCLQFRFRFSDGCFLIAILVAQLSPNLFAQNVRRPPSVRINQTVMVEGESLVATAKASDGRVVNQSMAQFGRSWSNASQLFWKPRGANSTLRLSVNVPAAGNYSLFGWFTKAPDYGIFQVGANGRQAGQFDGFNFRGVVHSGQVSLGQVPLVVGMNQIVLVITGKHPRSTGFMVGIDRLQFVPATKKTDGQIAGGQIAGGQIAGGQIAGGQIAGGQKKGNSIVIEGESLVPLARATQGRVNVQDMRPFGRLWSGNSQLSWVPPQAGHQLTLNVSVPTSGDYQVAIYFTQANNCGDFIVFAGGTQLGTTQKGFSQNVVQSGRKVLGNVKLRQGVNQFVVTGAGKDARSIGWVVGLDKIELTPTTKIVIDTGVKLNPLARQVAAFNQELSRLRNAGEWQRYFETTELQRLATSSLNKTSMAKIVSIFEKFENVKKKPEFSAIADGPAFKQLHSTLNKGLAASFVQQVKVLPNNILITSTPYFENTCKAVPPSPTNPGGSIAIVTGEPRPTAQLLRRPIYDSNGNIDRSTSTVVNAYPTGSEAGIATDNQIVRMKNGNLLAVKNGYRWDTLKSPPDWFDETIRGGAFDRTGHRGALLLFRSTDGGANWTLHASIDFATFLSGRFGIPRPMSDTNDIDVSTDKQGKHADGSLKWYVGGGDRTELYACPFTGYVYMTTRCKSGPYDTEPFRDQMLLLYSKDFGKTWTSIKDDLPGLSPLVMTSTPNGRLFLFQIVSGIPKLYVTSPLLGSSAVPILSDADEVHYVENGANIAAGLVQGPTKTSPGDVVLLSRHSHPSLSRISIDTSSSKIRIAYHSLDANAIQQTRVISVDVKDKWINKSGLIPQTIFDPDLIVKPLTTVRAENSQDYSVLYFNFIDPDYIDMPTSVRSNTSVAYWIEAPKRGLTSQKYSIRYVVFSGEKDVTAAQYLSVQNGQPRTWSMQRDVGDYLDGGFFWHNNSLNYVAQWVEPNGIWANIVSVPYGDTAQFKVFEDLLKTGNLPSRKRP